MSDFRICFPLGREMTNRTELYDKLVREFGVGGMVKREMGGSVVGFEVVMDYGVLKLGCNLRSIALRLGLDGYGEIFEGILTIDEISVLYEKLKACIGVETDEKWYIGC